MDKEKIIEILNEWNFWKKDIDCGIPREKYLNPILQFLKSGKVISIVGVRRSGKSTIVKQIAKTLIEEGVPRNDILIINFEEPQLENVDVSFLVRIYQAYREIIRPAGKPYLFLDEIQNVKKWERFVRSINERKDAHLVISGSSSKLLSEELATVLTGRQLYFEVFPLSFEELLGFKNIKIKERKDILLSMPEIKSFFREYLSFGGFPEIVLSNNEEFRRRVLVSYYEDIINRDIVQRFKIKKIEQLRALVQFYLTNISSHISFNRISRFIKLPVETVRRFSSYIETSDLVFFLKRFSFSLKEQENSTRKVYSIDVGLSNTVGFKFSKDLGKTTENLVALKLKMFTKLSPGREIYYWKNHYGDKEVDFVVKDALQVKNLIQVCWDVSDERTKKREVNALLKAIKEFKLREGLIITEDYEDEEKIEGKKIIFTPIWKWLL